MNLSREINRLMLAVLLCFALIALAATYWAVVGPDTILLRDDNPRQVIAEASIQRGSIYDRSGQLLVESTIDDAGNVTRSYLASGISSVVGYSSLRYGVGGAESAYDSILRGDDLPRNLLDSLAENLFHRPQIGSHLKLSIDLDIQQAATETLNGQPGAAVVISVTDGAVLGLVSDPTFDPGTLDTDWDHLVEAPDKPFFNRVIQGNYQPGGLLETPLMAAALLAREPLTEAGDNTNQPVILDDLELRCALPIPFENLSLRDAYAFACPQPFADLATQLGPDALNEIFETFSFQEPAVLGDFTLTSESEGQAVTSITINHDNLVNEALGQGDLTVTPLQMAVMVAAILNDGNAPHPYLLQSTQAPEGGTWLPAQTTHPTTPFTTQNTARELQDLMRHAVANGTALNAARPGIDIGGHATLAYSGEESQAWFIGFATLAGGRGVAVAVVLENSVDPGLAADRGGTILAAAHRALQPAQN